MPIRTLFLLLLPTCIFSLKAGASLLLWDRTEALIEMAPGQAEATVTYRVTNNGDKALRIKSIESSSECTKTIIEKQILEPGESTRIKAVFIRGKRLDKTHTKMDVFLDDIVGSVATLHLIVDLPKLVEIEPNVIYWNKDNGFSACNVHVKLDRRYVDSVTAIHYDKGLLRVTDEGSQPGKEGFFLKINAIDATKPLRDTITIEAAGPLGMKAAGKVLVLLQP